MAQSLPTSLYRRVKPIGRFFFIGLVLGIVTWFVLFGYSADIAFTDRKSFAFGALLLATGLVGWSGSIFAGRGIENLQEYLDMNTNWSAPDSKQAMVKIGSVGFGWMIGGSLMTRLVLFFTG